MSVTTMLDKVDSDFAAFKSKADSAIASLNIFAQFNEVGVDYNMQQGDNNYLYSESSYLPIEAIRVADTMIAEVEALATEIGNIAYVPPTDIGPFQMIDHKVWKDALADQIEVSISTYISTLGIPEKAFQDAIFNESYERNQQTLNDMLDLADAKVGAKGFTYPNSMVTALKIEAMQKYQFDYNQVNRDITKLVTEWARQNYQFSIQQGIAFETFHADFTYKYCTAFVQIYKDLIIASVERFKAELAQYLEPIKVYVEAAKLPVDVAKINADISTENAKLSIESNKLQIEEALEAFKTRTQASITTFTQQIHALESVAAETAKFIQSAARSVIGIQK
jgi:hypothetical protein